MQDTLSTGYSLENEQALPHAHLHQVMSLEIEQALHECVCDITVAHAATRNSDVECWQLGARRGRGEG